MVNLNTDMNGRAMLCFFNVNMYEYETMVLGLCIVRFYVAYYFISVLIG